MSERKIFGKFIKDSDQYQSQIKKNKTFNYIRYMVPFNIQCLSCLNTIKKGKKINAIKENVFRYNNTAIKIFRFYFKCNCCQAGISLKTNPNDSKYSIEINSIETSK
nr:hypothetical protein 1634Bnrm3_p043 [Cryptomonas sp.]